MARGKNDDDQHPLPKDGAEKEPNPNNHGGGITPSAADPSVAATSAGDDAPGKDGGDASTAATAERESTAIKDGGTKLSSSASSAAKDDGKPSPTVESLTTLYGSDSDSDSGDDEAAPSADPPSGKDGDTNLVRPAAMSVVPASKIDASEIDASDDTAPELEKASHGKASANDQTAAKNVNQAKEQGGSEVRKDEAQGSCSSRSPTANDDKIASVININKENSALPIVGTDKEGENHFESTNKKDKTSLPKFKDGGVSSSPVVGKMSPLVDGKKSDKESGINKQEQEGENSKEKESEKIAVTVDKREGENNPESAKKKENTPLPKFKGEEASRPPVVGKTDKESENNVTVDKIKKEKDDTPVVSNIDKKESAVNERVQGGEKTVLAKKANSNDSAQADKVKKNDAADPLPSSAKSSPKGGGFRPKRPRRQSSQLMNSTSKESLPSKKMSSPPKKSPPKKSPPSKKMNDKIVTDEVVVNEIKQQSSAQQQVPFDKPIITPEQYHLKFCLPFKRQRMKMILLMNGGGNLNEQQQQQQQQQQQVEGNDTMGQSNSQAAPTGSGGRTSHKDNDPSANSRRSHPTPDSSLNRPTLVSNSKSNNSSCSSRKRMSISNDSNDGDGNSGGNKQRLPTSFPSMPFQGNVTRGQMVMTGAPLRDNTMANDNRSRRRSTTSSNNWDTLSLGNSSLGLDMGISPAPFKDVITTENFCSKFPGMSPMVTGGKDVFQSGQSSGMGGAGGAGDMRGELRERMEMLNSNTELRERMMMNMMAGNDRNGMMAGMMGGMGSATNTPVTLGKRKFSMEDQLDFMKASGMDMDQLDLMRASGMAGAMGSSSGNHNVNDTVPFSPRSPMPKKSFLRRERDMNEVLAGYKKHHGSGSGGGSGIGGGTSHHSNEIPGNMHNMMMLQQQYLEQEQAKTMAENMKRVKLPALTSPNETVNMTSDDDDDKPLELSKKSKSGGGGKSSSKRSKPIPTTSIPSAQSKIASKSMKKKSKKKSQEELTTAILATTPMPTKPKRPFSAYNLFFQLEREYIMHEISDGRKPMDDGMIGNAMRAVGGDGADKYEYSEDKAGDQKIAHLKSRDKKPTDDDKHYNDPQIPQRYSHLTLDAHWYSVSHKTKRKHRKTAGSCGFIELTKMVSARWKGIDETDAHVKAYCQGLADMELENYKSDMDVYKKEVKEKEGKAKVKAMMIVADKEREEKQKKKSGKKKSGATTNDQLEELGIFAAGAAGRKKKRQKKSSDQSHSNVSPEDPKPQMHPDMRHHNMGDNNMGHFNNFEFASRMSDAHRNYPFPHPMSQFASQFAAGLNTPRGEHFLPGFGGDDAMTTEALAAHMQQPTPRSARGSGDRGGDRGGEIASLPPPPFTDGRSGRNEAQFGRNNETQRQQRRVTAAAEARMVDRARMAAELASETRRNKDVHSSGHSGGPGHGNKSENINDHRAYIMAEMAEIKMAEARANRASRDHIMTEEEAARSMVEARAAKARLLDEHARGGSRRDDRGIDFMADARSMVDSRAAAARIMEEQARIGRDFAAGAGGVGSVAGHVGAGRAVALEEALRAEARMGGESATTANSNSNIEKKFASLAEAEARHRMQMGIQGSMLGRNTGISNSGSNLEHDRERGLPQDRDHGFGRNNMGRIPPDASAGGASPPDFYSPYSRGKPLLGQAGAGGFPTPGSGDDRRRQVMEQFAASGGGGDRNGMPSHSSIGGAASGDRDGGATSASGDGSSGEQQFDMEVERFLSCLGRDIKEKHRKGQLPGASADAGAGMAAMKEAAASAAASMVGMGPAGTRAASGYGASRAAETRGQLAAAGGAGDGAVMSGRKEAAAAMAGMGRARTAAAAGYGGSYGAEAMAGMGMSGVPGGAAAGGASGFGMQERMMQMQQERMMMGMPPHMGMMGMRAEMMNQMMMRNGAMGAGGGGAASGSGTSNQPSREMIAEMMMMRRNAAASGGNMGMMTSHSPFDGRESGQHQQGGGGGGHYSRGGDDDNPSLPEYGWGGDGPH